MQKNRRQSISELTVKVRFSNLDKILYPGGRVTKREVLDYYTGVAKWLLPHFKNRPVTLKRYPNGVFGEAFYEKDAPAFTPEWVETYPVPRVDSTQPPICYILINDVATLAWTANLACLELHPFLHRAPKLNQPTHIVFDLDPGEGADILLCCEVAFLLRDLLSGIKLKCFPKVSGSKGIQVYVPLNTPATYDETQPFARAVAELMGREHPDLIVSEMTRAVRRGRVFIDWSQNAIHKTTIGVYSLRAKRERPYISMPVTWEELKQARKSSNADMLYFLPEAAVARLHKVGDLFAPVLKLKQHLPKQFLAPDSAKTGRGSVVASTQASKRLRDYAAKRNFARTVEPAPAAPRRSAQGSRRRFVVQKHAASHLHFDFRLEMADVLKSWAVPRGVPVRDGETRSAFATEDHPLDYLQFEGNIPQGQYGGGSVMVWDIGTYEVLEGNYWKGRLAVFLAGKKLKGEWILEKAGEQGGKTTWLLTKTNGNARRVLDEDRSALTGRTMEQIRASDGEGRDGKGERREGKTERSQSKAQRRGPSPVAAPQFVPPMKATLTSKLPKGEGWIYEVKWDGYRALAAKHGDTVRLLSLKNKSLNSDFPGAVAAVRGIAAETALLDGEIVAVDNRGKPSFQMLQNRASLGRDWHIVYYAFDLLNLEGEDLTRRPLGERRRRLREIIEDSGVRFSADLSGSAELVLDAVRQAGLEGVIAKRCDSTYEAGSRVTSWLKLKLEKSQEFVIGGYNPSGKTFQSLLVGYYDRGTLLFAGKVRQGLYKWNRADLMKKMQPLMRKGCPFANLPSSKRNHFGEGVTAEEMHKLVWIEPRLVAECTFAEWTSYGLLRHGTFVGLREDKDAAEVTKEEP